MDTEDELAEFESSSTPQKKSRIVRQFSSSPIEIGSSPITQSSQISLSNDSKNAFIKTEKKSPLRTMSRKRILDDSSPFNIDAEEELEFESPPRKKSRIVQQLSSSPIELGSSPITQYPSIPLRNDTKIGFIKSEKKSPSSTISQRHHSFSSSPILLGSSPISSYSSDMELDSYATNEKSFPLPIKKEKCSDEIAHVTKRLFDTDYFLGDHALPIYRQGLKQGINSKDILFDMCMGSPPLATRVPLGVNINAIFIFNIAKLGHKKDILSDGCGVWNQTNTKSLYFELKDGTVIPSDVWRYGDEGVMKLTRLSYRHTDSLDFHRIVFFLTKHDGRKEIDFTKAATQYYFEGKEHAVVVKAHGNSKGKKPFHRTNESVKLSIKEKLMEKSKPKEIVHSILENTGGIHNIHAAGEHVRDRHQVSNFAHAQKRHEDPLLEVMEMCKIQARCRATAFVREVSISPEMTVFMANEQQLIDIERFCTNVKEFSILGVDSTFNVGDYYLTLTTYRNLMLNTRKGQLPVFIGPALIHQRRLVDSYFNLPSFMIKFNPNLKQLLVYGSDCERAISTAFSSCFASASHLLCDIHMKDNILLKLRELGIKKDTASKYISDIFGVQVQDKKVPGLVDSFSKEDVDKKLDDLEQPWRERHPNGSDFYAYIKTFKAESIKNCMSADLRSMSGLGFPPAMYNQNANECANSVIKRDLNTGKLSVKECVDHVKGLIDRQNEEARLAMIGRGEYSVRDKYTEYAVEENIYYRMSQKQKEAAEKKFFRASMESNEEQTDAINKPRDFVLSVRPDKCQILNISYASVEIMFNKASELVQTPGDIVESPGSSLRKTFLVKSSENKNSPHQIKINGVGNQISCDNKCINWSTTKICSHSIAVAEITGNLTKFLTWYNNSTRGPNFTAFSNVDMPSGRGKKATKATQRRKGGDPNRTLPEVMEYIKPTLPNPSEGSYLITLLRFCHENTKSCYGCKTLFRIDGYPICPRDLVVVTKGLRKYTGTDGSNQAKKGNIYFHLNEACIKIYNSYFSKVLFEIPNDVKPKLDQKHLEFLRNAQIKV